MRVHRVHNKKEGCMRNLHVRTSSIGSLLLGCVLTAGCGSGDESAVAQGVSPPPDVSGVTQNWDKALPAASRFVVLPTFNNDAVRDNETGLVWEKSPQVTTSTWRGARFACINKNVGGRKGWRLPAISELASLIDPSAAVPGPTLPPGHPFLNVQSAHYWSAPTSAEAPVDAWAVNFNDGLLFLVTKTISLQVWCVRGGMQVDQY